MRYIDRHSLGLELYFSDETLNLTGLRECTPETLKERLQAAPERSRAALSAQITAKLLSLGRFVPTAFELLPESIRLWTSAQYKGRYSSTEHLMTFFDWFMKLQSCNVQQRVNRISEIKNLSAHLDTPYEAVFTEFFSLGTQRVIITKESDSITITSAEREWGQLSFKFGGCTDLSVCVFPLPGYIFAAEGYIEDNACYHLGLIIDSVFSDDDSAGRILEEESWHELGFSFKDVEVILTEYDVPSRLDRIGTSKFSMVKQCCELLINKCTILGSWSLATEERNLLPIAQYLYGSLGLLSAGDAKGQAAALQLISDAYGNRYGMMLFTNMMDKCKCEALSEPVSKAWDHFDQGKATEILKESRTFAIKLVSMVADGSARLFLFKLSEQFSKMKPEPPDGMFHESAETIALDRIKAVIEPEMERMGFEGTYPHYRRQHRKRMEYISFRLNPVYDKPRHGSLIYNISIAAAQLSPSRCSKLSANGLSLDATNALDCVDESPDIAKYAELASGDDMQAVIMELDILGDEPVLVVDDSAKLTRFIAYAEKQFKWGRIPGKYRKQKKRARRALKNGAPFARTFVDSLPVGVLLSIALLLSYLLYFKEQSFYPLDTVATALIALGAGLALTAVITVLRRHGKSYKLWRY